MAFAQLIGGENLRDIGTRLRAMQQLLHHADQRGRIVRGGLVDALGVPT